MFVPGIYITIKQKERQITFDTAHEILVRKSIHSMMNTAVVKIPVGARLKKGEFITASQPVTRVFSIGEPIEIKIGYGQDLKTEFKGFISRINPNMPCEIQCEGYGRQLRNSAPFNKLYKNVQLKTVLNELIADTDIILHKNIQDVTLDQLQLTGKNAMEAIEKIKQQTGFIAFFINHRELYIGLKYAALSNNEVKFKLGWNTLKDDELKFRSKDQNILYTVSYKDSRGREHHFSTGEKGGQTFNYDFGYMSSKDVATVQAKVLSSNDAYEGYEGSITSFLEPYIEPAEKAIVLDPDYEERTGSFITVSTETILNSNGGRRKVEVGASLVWLQTNKV